MARAYLTSDPSLALDVNDVRNHVTATIFTSCSDSPRAMQISEVLADVWISNILAVVHDRRWPDPDRLIQGL